MSTQRDEQRARTAAADDATQKQQGPWLSRRVAVGAMVLLTASVFGLVWFSAPPGADWHTSLRVAVVMSGLMWVVFLFVFTLSRWLRSR